MKCVGGNKQRSGPIITVVVCVEVERRRTPVCVRSQATPIYVVAIVMLLYRTTTLVRNSEYMSKKKKKKSIILCDPSPDLKG